MVQCENCDRDAVWLVMYGTRVKHFCGVECWHSFLAARRLRALAVRYAAQGDCIAIAMCRTMSETRLRRRLERLVARRRGPHNRRAQRVERRRLQRRLACIRARRQREERRLARGDAL